jgi:hypothetical protein
MYIVKLASIRDPRSSRELGLNLDGGADHGSIDWTYEEDIGICAQPWFEARN